MTPNILKKRPKPHFGGTTLQQIEEKNGGNHKLSTLEKDQRAIGRPYVGEEDLGGMLLVTNKFLTT